MWTGSRNAPQAACARLLAKTNAEPYSEPNTYRIGLRCSSCSVALYRDPEGVRARSKNPSKEHPHEITQCKSVFERGVFASVLA